MTAGRPTLSDTEKHIRRLARLINALKSINTTSMFTTPTRKKRPVGRPGLTRQDEFIRTLEEICSLKLELLDDQGVRAEVIDQRLKAYQKTLKKQKSIGRPKLTQTQRLLKDIRLAYQRRARVLKEPPSSQSNVGRKRLSKDVKVERINKKIEALIKRLDKMLVDQPDAEKDAAAKQLEALHTRFVSD